MDQRIVRTRPKFLTDLDFNVCLQREGQHRRSVVEHGCSYPKAGFLQKNIVVDRMTAQVLRRWIPGFDPISAYLMSVQFRHFKTRCSFSHAIPMDAVEEARNISDETGRPKHTARRKLTDPAAQ